MRRGFRRRRAAPGALVVFTLSVLVVPASVGALADAGHRAPPPPPGFFGVNASTLEPGDSQLMETAGVGVVRAVFPLPAARERPGGPYSWNRFDGLVEETAERGLDLTPVLYGVPPWVSTERSAIPIGNQESASEWRHFLEAVVARYGPLGDYWRSNPYVAYHPIETWQIWNEPNSKTWWGPRPRPQEYGVLLRRSANAIHSVDPGARIMTAGIVAHPTNNFAIPGNEFARRLFSAPEVAAITDIVAFHPYAATVRAAHRQLTGIRRVLDGVTVREIPVWVTEIGWGTRGAIDHPLIKTDRGQIRSLRDLFELVLRTRNRLGVERLLWYHWRDAPDDLCRWCKTSGLLDRRSRPKEIYEVFRAIAP